MHDLHEANKIFNLIIKKAKENKLKKVKKIVLKLGQIIEHGQSISPENLKFNLKLLFEGTVVDGAEVVVERSDESWWELVEIVGE